MKHRLLIITIILLAIVGVLWISNLLKVKWNHRPGSFVRLTRSHLATPEDTIQLSGPSFSIIGYDSSGLFLIDRATSIVYALDNLRNSVAKLIPTTALPNSQVSMVDGQINIANDSIVYQYQANRLQSYTTPGILTAFVPMTHDAAAIRIINPKTKLTQLGRMSFTEDSTLISKDYPQPGSDSVFSVDGMLGFSKTFKRIIYVHYYKNEILHLDTMLRLSFKSKTIDTTSIARIQVARIRNKIVMANPPPIVNKRICIDGSFLYIQSAVLAINEVPSQAMNNSTIDVYNLRDGQYMYSFYLQHLNGVPLSQFTIHDKFLYALHRDQLIRYHIGM